MICETPSPEIINACRVLFSQSTPVDASFLNAIAVADVKSAFRKKAKETHPDRATALGVDRDALNGMFRDVVAAYDVLKKLVDNPVAMRKGFSTTNAGKTTARPNTTARKAPPKRPQQKASQQDFQNRKGSHWQKASRPDDRNRAGFHFKGVFPNRELKLGEFLYYAGQISWKSLIEAIIWQRQQRPRVGEIAISWNILTMAEVIEIIQNKSYTQRFCEYALENGFFTPFQHLAVISRQKQLQPRFGEHFIQTGTFTQDHLKRIVRHLQDHNAKIRTT
ncbi:MAG: hypothetical protein SWH61_14970 [Thermodesulfobacteriota bacterium]|nr:hypothetical protein [Thermodesulfobacteriota bacterium]